MKTVLRFFVWALRHRGLEIALLQGTTLIALSASAGPALLLDQWLKVLLCLVGSVLTVAHVFTLNDWADAGFDREDPSKAGHFQRFGLTRPHVLFGSCALGAAGLFACALSSDTGGFWGLGVIACGWIYSHPKIYAKGIPVASSACHALGQIPHFMLGSAVVEAISLRAVSLALVFSLIFAAGHLVQETIDSPADSRAGILTNAAVFGPKKALLASFVFFTAAFVQLIWASHSGSAAPASVFGALFYPVYALSFFYLLASNRSKLDRRRLEAHRAVYRAVFAGLGGYLLFVNLSQPTV